MNSSPRWILPGSRCRCPGFFQNSPERWYSRAVAQRGRTAALDYLGGFSIWISPRSTVSPGLTVNSLRSRMVLLPSLMVE